VLILEDRPADAELMVEELRKAGFEPQWRRVATEADYIEALDASHDLILADHSLPQYDSVRALERFKASGLDIPFLIVSGTIGEELAVELMRAGAADYVLKDRMARLGQAVVQALEQKRLRDEKGQAEQKLWSSEARFRALIEKSSDAIFLLNPDMIVEYASQSLTRILGFLPEELLGRCILDLHDPEDRASSLQRLHQLQPGSTEVITGRFQRKDGSWCWLERTRSNLLDEPNVRAFVVNCRDVTERHDAEESLRLYRALLDRTNDAIEIVDPETGRFLDVNEKACVIHGYSRDEYLTLTVPQIDDLLADPSAYVSRAEHLRLAKSLTVEGLHRRKDGSTFPVEVNLNFVHLNRDYIVAVVRDTTERKQAEAALRASEERFRRITTNMLDMIAQTDVAGILQYVTPSNEAVLGYRAEEMVGRNTFDFLHPEDRSAGLTLFQSSLTSQTPARGECRFRHADGHYLWLEFIGNLIRDDDGNVCGTVIASRDVTERRAAEQALQREKLLSDTIIDSLPGVYYLFDQEGKYLRWNKNFKKVLGRTSAEIAQTHPLDLFRGRERETVAKIIQDLLTVGQPVNNVEASLCAKDGTATPYLFTGQRLVLNRVPCVTGMGVDISERKKADAQLRLQSAALEAAANGIVITDRQGNIVWVNPAFTRLTGYPLEEVAGKPPRTLKSGKHDHSFYQNLWSTITAGNVWHGELINRRKDGTLYTEEMTITPVSATGDGISHFIAIKQDVTERKRVEEKLHESALRLREAVGAANVGLWDWNLRNNEVFYSPEWKRQLGYEDHDIGNVFDEWQSRVHPDDLEGALARAHRYLAEPRGRYDSEFRLRHKDGSYRWMMQTGESAGLEHRFRRADGEYLWLESIGAPIKDDQGQVCGAVIASRDITERKQATEALHASRDFLNSVLENVPIRVFWKDRASRYLGCNSLFARDAGLTGPDELLGKDDFQLAWREQADAYRTDDQAVMAFDKPKIGYEEPETTAAGGTIWLRSSKVPLHDPEGTVIGLLGIYDDITERRAADEEVRKLNAELEERVRDRTAQLAAANKELEAFAYSISHDLRAPLRGIDGFSQALLEDYSDKLDADGQNYLRRVRAASQRMAKLIDDILLLSRTTRGAMSRAPANLSELAGRVISDLQASDAARHVEIRMPPELIADGDARLLEVVLMNLLGNAWKFTSKTEHARIELGVTDCKGQPAYFVRDNGAGFDMAFADKLFTPFQRLHSDAEFPGTGIGLPTVQRIIHRHGGEVWAEGAVGKGATFYFTLAPAVVQGWDSHV